MDQEPRLYVQFRDDEATEESRAHSVDGPIPSAVIVLPACCPCSRLVDIRNRVNECLVLAFLDAVADGLRVAMSEMAIVGFRRICSVGRNVRYLPRSAR